MHLYHRRRNVAAQVAEDCFEECVCLCVSVCLPVCVSVWPVKLFISVLSSNEVKENWWCSEVQWVIDDDEDDGDDDDGGDDGDSEADEEEENSSPSTIKCGQSCKWALALAMMAMLLKT